METLGLSGIYAQYEVGDGRGLAAYDARMRVRLLTCGYARRVRHLRLCVKSFFASSFTRGRLGLQHEAEG